MFTWNVNGCQWDIIIRDGPTRRRLANGYLGIPGNVIVTWDTHVWVAASLDPNLGLSGEPGSREVREFSVALPVALPGWDEMEEDLGSLTVISNEAAVEACNKILTTKSSSRDSPQKTLARPPRFCDSFAVFLQVVY
jgi:hypothetical protein